MIDLEISDAWDDDKTCKKYPNFLLMTKKIVGIFLENQQKALIDQSSFGVFLGL